MKHSFKVELQRQRTGEERTAVLVAVKTSEEIHDWLEVDPSRGPGPVNMRHRYLQSQSHPHRFSASLAEYSSWNVKAATKAARPMACISGCPQEKSRFFPLDSGLLKPLVVLGLK